MPVHFSVEDIRLLSVNYSLNTEANDNAQEDQLTERAIEINLECKTSYVKPKRILKVILSLSTESKDSPINLAVQMGGAFRLDSDPAKEEFDRLSHVNCPTIIFPYLREFVSDLTRRSGLTSLNLPPMNFVASGERRLAEKEQPKAE